MINSSIISACKRKDEKAFRQCYEACAPYAYTIIKNYIQDENSRRDAMQDAFAGLFTSFNNYDPNKGEFKSWFAKIVVRTCIAMLRKRKKLNLFVPLSETHDTEQNMEFLFQLKKADIEKLLAKMPEGYRTIFLLFVIDDYTHQEIAEAMNISKATSRSQLSRAIKWIQKNLGHQAKTLIYG